jgi:hypothetical protein
MILTELREMDFEEICHTVEAQNLVCEPRNQEHFEAHLPQELEQIASKLPLYICCSGGYYETGSATVKEEDVEISKSSSEEIRGNAFMDFKEYDPYHFTDGDRRARLDFIFEWSTAMLRVWCRSAGSD